MHAYTDNDSIVIIRRKFYAATNVGANTRIDHIAVPAILMNFQKSQVWQKSGIFSEECRKVGNLFAN